MALGDNGLYQALLEVAKARNRIAPDNIGQYGRGNIDLYNRPQYIQPDGSVSTVRSMSFGDGNGQEVLVPTIAYDNYGNPYQMSDRQAIDRYYDTGEYLGKFNSIADADNYGQALHNQQETLYSNDGLNARNTHYLNALYDALTNESGLATRQAPKDSFYQKREDAIQKVSDLSGMKEDYVRRAAEAGARLNYDNPAYQYMIDGLSEGDPDFAKAYTKILQNATEPNKTNKSRYLSRPKNVTPGTMKVGRTPKVTVDNKETVRKSNTSPIKKVADKYASNGVSRLDIGDAAATGVKTRVNAKNFAEGSNAKEFRKKVMNISKKLK